MSRTSIAPVGLSEQQLTYVKERSRGLTAATAARRAGYKHPAQAAWNVESNPRVQEALREELDHYRQAAQVEREEVIAGIKDAINMAKLVADPNAMIKGWTELAKMLGYYAPEVKRVELSVPAERQRHQLETMSDNDLLEIASGRKRVVEGEVITASNDPPEDETRPQAATA